MGPQEPERVRRDRAETSAQPRAAFRPSRELGQGRGREAEGDEVGGKLPITFPRTVGQIPIYYAHKNTGRPPGTAKWTSKYLDVPVTPQFPFGYGLSYTTFELSGLRLGAERIAVGATVNVQVTVKNAGARAGDEVVQIYVTDVAASVTRPVKQLLRARPPGAGCVEDPFLHSGARRPGTSRCPDEMGGRAG